MIGLDFDRYLTVIMHTVLGREQIILKLRPMQDNMGVYGNLPSTFTPSDQHPWPKPLSIRDACISYT